MDLISRSVVPGAYLADLIPARESVDRPKQRGAQPYLLGRSKTLAEMAAGHLVFRRGRRWIQPDPEFRHASFRLCETRAGVYSLNS